MEKHIQNLIFLKKDYYGAEVLRSLPGKYAFDQCRQGSAVCGMVTAVDEEIMGVTRLFIMCCPMDQEKVMYFLCSFKIYVGYEQFLGIFLICSITCTTDSPQQGTTPLRTGAHRTGSKDQVCLQLP